MSEREGTFSRKAAAEETCTRIFRSNVANVEISEQIAKVRSKLLFRVGAGVTS